MQYSTLRRYCAVCSVWSLTAAWSTLGQAVCEYDCKPLDCMRWHSVLEEQWYYIKYVGPSTSSCLQEHWNRSTSAHTQCDGRADRQVKLATGQDDCQGTDPLSKYAAKECVGQGEPFVWECCASCKAQST
jgi:hypothetical protein